MPKDSEADIDIHAAGFETLREILKGVEVLTREARSLIEDDTVIGAMSLLTCVRVLLFRAYRELERATSKP